MSNQGNSRRPGFTLIELVASAVLTSMMMVALMSIVWSAVRESKQLRESATSDFPVTHLIDQMRSDFHNARGMAVDSRGVTLHGFIGRDPATRMQQLVPGRVRYELRRVGERSILVRAAAGDVTEAVWHGMSAIRIDAIAEPDPENDLLAAPESGGLPEMPLSFRVTLVGDRRQLLWREVIHHHDE